MQILFLAFVLLAIIGLLALRRPLWQALLGGLVLLWALFRIAPADGARLFLNPLAGWSSLSVILVVYLIAFLQRVLDARGMLRGAQQDLDALFHNRRINASGAPVFRLGASVLPLPDAWRDRVAPLSDGPATLGVRPEAVVPAPEGAAGAILDAEVDVVEPMGAETYVYAAAEGASFVSRAPAGTSVRAGSRARFLLDLDRASLFGPDGRSLVLR